MPIIIDESFSDDDDLILEKVEQKKFDSEDVAKLKFDSITLALIFLLKHNIYIILSL